jgi:hypothetical protein
MSSLIMGYEVSRLDSGRAMLEDPPHVDFPGIFVDERTACEGRTSYGNPHSLASGNLV